MKHIKFGRTIVGIISFFIFLFFISCMSIKKSGLSQRNYFNKEYFYNDSLKVAIDFGEDVEFSDVSFLKTKEFKKNLKKYKELPLKNLFLAAKSIEKELEMSFFFEKLPDYKDTLTTQKILFRDSIANTIVFEKQKGPIGIIGFVKNNSKVNSFDVALQLASKMNVDSVEKWQFYHRLIFRNYFEEGNPNDLLARKKLDKIPFKNYSGDEMKFSLVATVNSFISNNSRYDSLINTYETKFKKKYDPMLLKMSSNDTVYKNDSVFDKIAEIAKNNQVIILNENHFYPNNRLFAMQMLAVLKQNGFTNLSLEAFDPSEYSKITYFPNHEDGVYTSEPYFAHFLRKAKELGFAVQGHESHKGCVVREVDQAENIYKILKANPKAKILVYVGFSHLEKENLNDSERIMMATVFKEISGINPITINQTSIHASNKEALLLLPRNSVNDSLKKESSADYFLVNNLKPDLRKIYTAATFKNIEIESKKFKQYKSREVVVEVIDFEEYSLLNKSAIPISSFLVSPKNKKIGFELPLGKYHVYVKTTDNTIIYDNDLIVN